MKFLNINHKVGFLEDGWLPVYRNFYIWIVLTSLYNGICPGICQQKPGEQAVEKEIEFQNLVWQLSW